MQNQHPKPVEDYMTANMILLFVNLLWIYVAIWSVWGLVPILLISVALNHMITRLEVALNARETASAVAQARRAASQTGDRA